MRGWKKYCNHTDNGSKMWNEFWLPFSFFDVGAFLVSFTNPLAASQVRRGTCLELSLLILWHSFCHPGIPRIPPTGSWFLWLGWDCGWHHWWLTVIMVYLANLFNVLYIHDIETDWVDPFTQPSQYWECDEKYDGNFSRVLENRHISSKSWYEL